MRLATSILALSLAAFAAAGPVGAQTYNPTEVDLRCTLVALTVAGGEDKPSAEAGQMMVGYFIGRL